MSAEGWADCPKCKQKDVVREDYEQGILNDEYFVDYKAKCYTCDFKHEFHHKEKVNYNNRR